MTRVNIVVEGQTEETFVKEILAPALGYKGVYANARLLGRPGHQGGRVNYARVKTDVAAFLKQDTQAYCTTLLDLYGLGKGFPGSLSSPADIERVMKADLHAALGHRWRADVRFIPYVQRYEFEGLLFSNPAALAAGMSRPHLSAAFQEIRAGFQTPEDINDSPQTAPSKRILRLHPPYQKPTHGVLAAKAIGLEIIRRECPRFAAWVKQLESLGRQDP